MHMGAPLLGTVMARDALRQEMAMVRDMWRADMDVLRAQWKESMHAELLDSAYGSMSYAAGVPTSDAVSGKRKTRYCVDGTCVYSIEHRFYLCVCVFL